MDTGSGKTHMYDNLISPTLGLNLTLLRAVLSIIDELEKGDPEKVHRRKSARDLGAY